MFVDRRNRRHRTSSTAERIAAETTFEKRFRPPQPLFLKSNWIRTLFKTYLVVDLEESSLFDKQAFRSPYFVKDPKNDKC
jgi:hypothetical protein